jgi:NitT/TauT family transport system ATP-binding protein
MSLLRARAVWKIYAARRGTEVIALRDLNLHVEENEFVSLIGPSGCGKSTFLHLVAGLDEITQGELWFDGRPVEGPGADRGMVFQSYTLYPWLTVRENIRFALQKSGLPRADQERRVEEVLALVGLHEFGHAHPYQLSGGMRQRVAIARALVYRPRLLLMDEPFGALDAQTRRLMQELLLSIWESHRTTVLFVTHDVEEALLLSDRIYVMTARPGTIKAELSVPFPRPRRPELETTPEFLELRQQLLEWIRGEVRW